MVVMSGGFESEVIASEQWGLWDNLEIYGGPIYSRPAVSEFVGEIEEVFELVEEGEELRDELLEENFEAGLYNDYDFDYNTEKPESPVGSFGFQVGLSNRLTEGYQAKVNYSMMNIGFSARGENEIWIDFDTEDEDDFNEAELDFTNELDIDVNMRLHGAEAEFSIPLLMRGERDVVNILSHFTLNIGAGYYWGSGDYEVSFYEYERFTGEDADGEEFDEEEEDEDDYSAEIELEGTGGLNIGGGFNYEIDNNILFFADINYRYLEMDMDFSNSNQEDLNGVINEDFSGLEFKAGFGYSF